MVSTVSPSCLRRPLRIPQALRLRFSREATPAAIQSHAGVVCICYTRAGNGTRLRCVDAMKPKSPAGRRAYCPAQSQAGYDVTHQVKAKRSTSCVTVRPPFTPYATNRQLHPNRPPTSDSDGRLSASRNRPQTPPQTRRQHATNPVRRPRNHLTRAPGINRACCYSVPKTNHHAEDAHASAMARARTHVGSSRCRDVK